MLLYLVFTRCRIYCCCRPEGDIKSQWAGRSVINSCAKLAYPMVQQMIEGCFKPEDWQVKLLNGVTWDEVGKH